MNYYKNITSIHHDLVTWVIQLHDKKQRQKENLFIIEGKRAIDLAYTSQCRIHTLFCTQDTLSIACEYAQEKNIIVVNEAIMKKISTQTTAAGLLGIFHIPKQEPINALQNGIVLAQIQDPGNMGTLIRTAVALKLPSIIIIDGCDPYSPKVVQSSAGTISFAKITICSWNELAKAANEQNICLSALVVEHGIPIHDIKPKNKRLLIIGNEAHGIPQPWIDDTTEQITIPMPGNAESLNAAVAGSIAAYLVYMH